MKLIYPGPFPAVEVPSIRATATQGEPVEVADAAVAASLIDQGWIVADSEPKGRKAATTKADPAESKE